MPSSKKAYQTIVMLVGETGTGPIYDLGSGWGSLVIRLAKTYPERQVVGYELSFFPYLVSKIIKRILRLNNLALYREDFLKVDLKDASVLTCYLIPALMNKIKHKIKHESGELHFIISNNFSLPTYQASKVIQLNDFYKSPVYLYQIQ